VQAWLAGNGVGRAVRREAACEVGLPRVFPFFRVRRAEGEQIMPAAPLPLPELLDLAEVPAELVADADPPEAAPASGGGAPRGPRGGPAVSDSPDPALLEALLGWSGEAGQAQTVTLERRVYYPLAVRHRGAVYRGVVDAAVGGVHLRSLPGGQGRRGELTLVLAAGLPLFAEAVLIPGLFGRLAAIGATALALLPLLGWLEKRHA